MSQEYYRRGLQDVLERLRDQGRLDAIPRSEHHVRQLLELAYTNVKRTRFLLAERDRVRCREQAAALRAMRSSSFGEATAAAGTLA
jgi:hypothetical protein